MSAAKFFIVTTKTTITLIGLILFLSCSNHIQMIKSWNSRRFMLKLKSTCSSSRRSPDGNNIRISFTPTIIITTSKTQMQQQQKQSTQKQQKQQLQASSYDYENHNYNDDNKDNNSRHSNNSRRRRRRRLVEENIDKDEYDTKQKKRDNKNKENESPPMFLFNAFNNNNNNDNNNHNHDLLSWDVFDTSFYDYSFMILHDDRENHHHHQNNNDNIDDNNDIYSCTGEECTLDYNDGDCVIPAEYKEIAKQNTIDVMKYLGIRKARPIIEEWD